MLCLGDVTGDVMASAGGDWLKEMPVARYRTDVGSDGFDNDVIFDLSLALIRIMINISL